MPGAPVVAAHTHLGDRPVPRPRAALQDAKPLIDEPLLPILAGAAMGSLRQKTVRLADDRLAGVVLASRGYPESAESGQPIDGIDRAEAIPGVTVYHAGTAKRGRQLVTSGGRVLTVVGRGSDFAEAVARAYTGVMQISFDGMHYRHDIGRQALKAESR